MFTVYITYFILFLKLLSLFLLRVFLYEVIYIKVFFIIFIIFSIYLIYHFNFKTSKKSQDITEIYGLYTYTKHIINYLIIFSYIFLVFFGFLWLCFSLKSHSINLTFYYKKLILVLKVLSLVISLEENLINIFLFILVFIFYILILFLITKLFKNHLIKRHLYFTGTLVNYQEVVVYKIPLQWSLMHLCNSLDEPLRIIRESILVYLYPNYKQLSFTEAETLPYVTFIWNVQFKISSYITRFLYSKFHYLILFLAIIYDLWYTPYILTHLFVLLPYVFLWDTYRRISLSLEHLHGTYDDWLYSFIYDNVAFNIDNDEIILDGRYIDLKDFAIAVNFYLKEGLNYQLAREKEYKDNKKK